MTPWKSLSAEEISLAQKLWSSGKNTFDIAKILQVPEALVFNGRSYSGQIQREDIYIGAAS